MSNQNLSLIAAFSLLFVFSMAFPQSFAETGLVELNSHDVSYEIENGNIDSILLEPDFFELIVSMNTQDDGTIQITIPRDILDAKFDSTDDMFFVLVDGFETDYAEIQSDSESRTLVIPFFSGDSIIEILGTDTSDSIVMVSEEDDDVAGAKIPDWIKNNAGWWSQDLIGDSDFVSGIQYLINEGIMAIPSSSSSTNQSDQSIPSQQIPDWIKNNAGWWSQDLIGDSDFVSGIQYLITNGIMQV